MDEIEKITGRITGIHSERIVLNESFLDFSARFASMPGTVILMSGGDHDCARNHILAARPWLTFSATSNNVTVTAEGHSFQFEADPLDTLRTISNTFSLENPHVPVPVAAGLFGYLSYDLKDRLEKLPRTSIDDLCLPHICLFAPSILVVQDKIDGSTRLCVPKRTSAGKSNLYKDLDIFESILAQKPGADGGFSGDAGGFRSNFTRANYMEAIERIKEYIASGHVYQVNMSQRFEMEFGGDTFSLFKTLYNANPAPFFAYINAGDHQVISTSPERFILRTGKRVETRPIKGTRPRGKTPTEDKKFRRELRQSKKDEAELSMIVDLLRNDLGKVCMAGSIRVLEHKRLEAYRNVYHLVSIVDGTLDRNCDSVDLIKATFPGGSITGCPKIRAMEIIDELEPDSRHIYTGAIGYISFHDTMDLSIAIRTATIFNRRLVFSVGGGIVFDSDPGDEYDETMHKGQTLMEVLKGKGDSLGRKAFVWINGIMVPEDEACVSVSDQGFQYGYGFFETIRVEKGKAKYLKEHTDRFYKTWRHLFSGPAPDLTWNDIINRVIIQNGLEDGTAAVKIIATKGDREELPFNHTLLVMARPYIHRLTGKKEGGLNLAVYPNPRQTPLADHKTLNYLYYFLAGKWATDNGADEALIINPDGTVSETNTANILLVKDKTVTKPASLHVLQGIMQRKVCELFSEWGYGIETRKVRPEDLFSVDQVVISNSLIGAIPVLSLDRAKLKSSSNLCERINNVVL